MQVKSLDDGRLLTTLVTLDDDPAKCAFLSPDGHYKGDPANMDKIREQLVYVVQTKDGQDTLTPAEFETKYGWKNDPAKVDAANK